MRQGCIDRAPIAKIVDCSHGLHGNALLDALRQVFVDAKRPGAVLPRRTWEQSGLGQLRIPIAINGMVHHHPGGLHVRVADSRANEGEPSLLHSLAHGFSFGSDGRHFTAVLEMVDLGFAADEGPDEGNRVFQTQPCLGVLARGIEFEAIANDAGLKHQCLDFGVGHGGNPTHVKVVHHLAVTCAFFQNGDPRQAGLEPFEQ